MIAQEADATSLAAMLEQSLELLSALQPGIEPFISQPGSAAQVQIRCLADGQPPHPALNWLCLFAAKTLGFGSIIDGML